jgi:hypothetical protein
VNLKFSLSGREVKSLGGLLQSYGVFLQPLPFHLAIIYRSWIIECKLAPLASVDIQTLVIIDHAGQIVRCMTALLPFKPNDIKTSTLKNDSHASLSSANSNLYRPLVSQ